MSQKISEELLGSIDWTDSTTGFCTCPGIAMHTGADQTRDCQVFLEGAPTIHCFHDSCASAVDEANLKLRRAIGKADGTVERLDTAKYVQVKRKDSEVSYRSRKLLDRLTEQKWETADMWEDSPYRLLDGPTHDWRRMLGLFEESDTIWIGDVKDSGSKEHQYNFRTADQWMKEHECPGQFTCPATFKPDSYSRSKANVLSRPYLVVESDELTTAEIGAVFRWINKNLPLYAVVDTGGKSLHGWFRYPPESQVPALKQILTELLCDKKMFGSSQPCRMPSAMRGDKQQSLLFYAPNGYQH